MKIKSKMGLLLGTLAIVLVVMVGLQAWQLYTLSFLLQSGSLAAGGSPQGSSLLAGLAGQVGGCGG